MVASLSGTFGHRTLGSGPFTIGRKPDNQLVLDDRTVSLHHAQIIPQGQGYSIIDLDSTNRTFVNEQMLESRQPRLLNSGDIIRVGDIRITYMVDITHDLDETIYAPYSASDKDETGPMRRKPQQNTPPEAPTIVVVPAPQPATQILKMPPPNPPPVPAIPPTQLASDVTQLAPTQSVGPATQPAPTQSPMNKTVSAPVSPATRQFTSPSSELPPPAELYAILKNLAQLIDKASQGNMEQYFPGDLPDKAKKIEEWKAQIQRAYMCAELLENPHFKQLDDQQKREILQRLTEATRVLDYTREYSVKLIGHTGVGKSTLLATMVGQDIFPRQAGGAVTAVPTHVRFCVRQDQEEMSVHFFTRQEFDEIIKQTQARHQETAVSDKELHQALTTELAFLTKVDTAYGKQYLRDGKPLIERFSKNQWSAKMSDFVEEPEKTTQEIRPTRLVKYAEFTIHTEDTHPILPPNSILVDLPGGAAGQPRHDMILREELNTTDAVILVVNSIRGGDDKETQHIFEQVKNKFVQDKGDKAASLMAFLVVTRWEEIRTQGEQNRIRKSMEKLLSKLPENYSHYHTHGGEKAFFYQLRVLDALIASLASNLATVGTIREQEGKEYLATVRTLYHRLRPIAEQLSQVPLPETFTAEQIQHVPPALHKAMLEFTGFAELGRDLQAFLARDRYDAQLTQARRDIDHALRLLEDVCRKNLHDLGFRNRTLQGLQQEKGRRQKQQDQILLKDLESHIYKMYTSWEDALKQFENRVYIEFPINLDEAYQRAKRALENRIWQGIFDEFIETNAQRDRNPTRLEQDLTDVRCQALIDRLRMSFMVIMEREVSTPATTLARTFLNPIEDMEAEGSLDIRKVALGEIGDELDLVEQLYKDIKDKISLMANDICRFVLMSELLDNTRYKLTLESPEVKALYQYVSQPAISNKTVHQDMIAILNRICADLVLNVENRIIRLFEYELDKLQSRAGSKDKNSPDAPNDGEFTNVVDTLRSFMIGRFYDPSATLRQVLEVKGGGNKNAEPWINLFQKIDELKRNVLMRPFLTVPV